MRNTKSIGDLGEAFVLAECVKRGLNICTPFGDNAKYDCVIEEPDGQLSKVQIKTSVPKDDYLEFSLSSAVKGVNGKYANTTYSNDDIDYFLLVDAVTHIIYKYEEFGKRSVILRFTEGRQKKGVNLASDFEW